MTASKRTTPETLHDAIVRTLERGQMKAREIADALIADKFPFKTKNPYNQVGAYIYGPGKEHFARVDGYFTLASNPSLAALNSQLPPAKVSTLNSEELAVTATQILATHQLARNCAAQAVLYAAKCGALMNKARESVGHGKFVAWIKKNCPAISHGTRYHYMALADEISTRLTAKFPAYGQLSQIEMSDPRDLKSDDNNKLVSAVRAVTNGKTISQLYLDFNIVKKGGKAAAAKDKRGPRTGDAAIDGASDAKLLVDIIAEKVSALELLEKHLTDDDRTRYVNALMSSLRSMGIPVTITQAA